MPPAASGVWKFFTKADDKKSASCHLCSTKIQIHGGTSNLHNHMKYKHPSENNNSKTPETAKQTSLTSFVSSPRKLGGSGKEKLTQAIADMVVSDYLPLSVVENKGFRNVMEIAAPDYKMPCRQTIHSRIVRRYDTEKEALTTRLRGISSAALTTDTWTSTTTDSYITVTEHHIDDGWNMCSNVLMTRVMPERHTGENLASRLKSCVSEYDLNGKIETVVHDNARNMESAGNLCEEWTDLGCFGHTLQLCVKPALELPVVSKTVARCRKLVGHFRHSTTLTAEMRTRQKLLGTPEHELIQDVPTRWNSCQKMLQRLGEQRRVVTDIMLDPVMTKKTDAGLLLKDAEWELVDDLSTVLQDLTDTTTYMSLEKSVSVSEVYPVVCGLLQNSLARASDDSPTTVKVKDAISGELKRRFQPSEYETAKSVPVLASLVDIRHKRLNFLTREQKSTARDALESCMDEAPLKLPSRDVDVTEPTPAKRPRLGFLVSASPEKETSSDELDAYLAERSHPDMDPLEWWRLNQKRFPTVAHVARKLLCVPATSVPSERVFSNAGRLITQLRNRLTSDIVDKIIFLNKN